MTAWPRSIALATAGVCLVALSACYEDADVTLFEPGVYKGAQDPLLAKQRSPAQQDRLRDRLQLVQTDR